jgi:hypothetical protein
MKCLLTRLACPPVGFFLYGSPIPIYISDHDADLIDQCLADLTAKRERLDAAMNAAAAIRSEDHAALFEDYMVVVYQISRMRAGIHPMVGMLEECPALAPLRDLHNQLRRLL